MSDIKLAPCPFCGESERIGIDTYGDYVECEGCHALGPSRDPDGKRWSAAHRPETGMTREEIAVRAFIASHACEEGIPITPEIACESAESLVKEFVRRGWRRGGAS